MNAVYKATGLSFLLLLAACGNKGDLYLNEVELSDEQKALLDELDAEKAKKKQAKPPINTQ